MLNLIDIVLLLLVGNFVNSTMPLLSKDLLSGKNAEASPIFQSSVFPKQIE